MTVVEASTVVDAPATEVWKVVSDPRNLPRWDRRIGRVEALTLLPGCAEPLHNERVNAAVGPLEAAFGQLPVQVGNVDEALSDPGVDPLPVPVQPRPA